MGDSYAVVVAHPDDEVLWCSSIVAEAKQVIICFADTTTSRKVSEGRRKLACVAPRNYVLLGISEATYIGVNRAGMILVEEREMRDRENELERAIKGVLTSRKVFTHNPWGEYGHPEHRQVHRIMHKICQDSGYELNVFGYYNRNTFKQRHLYTDLLREGESRKEKTDMKLFQRMKVLYQELGCWTWNERYIPARHEIFHRLYNTGGESRATNRVPGVYISRLTTRSGKRLSDESCMVTKGGIESYLVYYLDSMLHLSLSLLRACVNRLKRV